MAIDYNYDGEWTSWECPNCGEKHDDPENIGFTCCRHCKKIVFILDGILEDTSEFVSGDNDEYWKG